jgi:glutamate synthase (NADPH/NADH) large chain
MEAHGLVDVMHDMTRHDQQRLRSLIEKHRRYTGSAKAQRILENWEDYAAKFVKVMPVDYRLALEKMQAAQIKVSQVSH